jgi:hypothetical protein
MVQVRFTANEALVLFEWLARTDEFLEKSFEHPSEQKVLWLLEGQLEKLVPVFSPNYCDLVQQAKEQIGD